MKTTCVFFLFLVILYNTAFVHAIDMKKTARRLKRVVGGKPCRDRGKTPGKCIESSFFGRAKRFFGFGGCSLCVDLKDLNGGTDKCVKTGTSSSKGKCFNKVKNAKEALDKRKKAKAADIEAKAAKPAKPAKPEAARKKRAEENAKAAKAKKAKEKEAARQKRAKATKAAADAKAAKEEAAKATKAANAKAKAEAATTEEEAAKRKEKEKKEKAEKQKACTEIGKLENIFKTTETFKNYLANVYSKEGAYLLYDDPKSPNNSKSICAKATVFVSTCYGKSCYPNEIEYFTHRQLYVTKPSKIVRAKAVDKNGNNIQCMYCTGPKDWVSELDLNSVLRPKDQPCWGEVQGDLLNDWNDTEEKLAKNQNYCKQDGHGPPCLKRTCNNGNQDCKLEPAACICTDYDPDEPEKDKFYSTEEYFGDSETSLCMQKCPEDESELTELKTFQRKQCHYPKPKQDE